MKQGEIYLVRFPFTDLTSTKFRPAMIISNTSFNQFENLMFVGIFWNKWNPCYSLEITNSQLEEWKLNKVSFFRFQNTFSLHKSLVVKKVGSIKQSNLKEISSILQSFISVK